MQISDAHYSHLQNIVDLALQKQAEKNPKDRNAFSQIMLWENDIKTLLDKEANANGNGDTSAQNGE